MDLFSDIYSYFVYIFSKLNFFFYPSDWLRLLLIVCGDIETNPDPYSDWRDRVLYSNIRGLHDNLDEMAVAKSDYVWFVLSLKCLIADISQSSVSQALVVLNKG